MIEMNASPGWVDLARHHERYLFAGAGAVAEKANLGILLKKRASLIGSTLRNRSLAFKANLVQNLRKDFADERKRGDIKPIIDKVCRQHQMLIELSSDRGQLLNIYHPSGVVLLRF